MLFIICENEFHHLCSFVFLVSKLSFFNLKKKKKTTTHVLQMAFLLDIQFFILFVGVLTDLKKNCFVGCHKIS
jgi:hypothetical protein